MNNVMYQTKMFNKEIRHSNEYNQYIRVLNQLKQKPELYERTKDFRRRNMELQVWAEYNTLEEVGKLRKEFEDILNQPAVIEFLGAEQRISSMIRRVEASIFEGIELDTEIF